VWGKRGWFSTKRLTRRDKKKKTFSWNGRGEVGAVIRGLTRQKHPAFLGITILKKRGKRGGWSERADLWKGMHTRKRGKVLPE